MPVPRSALMAKYIMAFDAGTTSSRAILFDGETEQSLNVEVEQFKM